jgi:hypothetical protein
MRKPFAAGVFCFAFAALAAAAPAMAKALPQDGVTRDFIIGWLKSRGHPAELEIDGASGTAYVSTSADGVDFWIYFYDCNGAVCPDMQYSTVWTDVTGLTADKLNAWNRDKRYIRAYMRDADAFGEYDVDLAPGGTTEQLDHSLDRWVEAMMAFKAFLGE